MIERVAFLSIHTSPLASPGTGDAGGMNVYVHELATTLAGRGVQVDVFTRGGGGEVEVIPGYRVIEVPKGTARRPGREPLADIVGDFAEGVARWAVRHRAAYDVLHSHYWLSGWAGLILHEVLRVPLAISFHTLGRVKDATRRPDQAPAGLLRIAAETEVIARAGCVIASTQAEAAQLIEHYAANPERLCVSPPGVDHSVFHPGDRAAARSALGLAVEGRLVLFVGRIQPLKGVDVALAAFALVATRLPDCRLLVVGGPSGPQGMEEMAFLRAGAVTVALGDRVLLRDPLPHRSLAGVYQAADVVVVPSRSESFGLVAAEAQACGIPVVASAVGGLAHVVADGESGLLVPGWDPPDYADALHRILTDPQLADRLARGAVANAEQFSWRATVDRLLELYAGIS
ncbi:MAG: D-inositol-3-phosphate glycosyltransferase [Acidobacteria bacterium]|nr:D-inositol-3-phosphate glycosyltransferase [Acidobacteriota bacterium]